MSWGSSPAGLCWLSAHLLQYGPDEPSWTWTQIRVQARMLDYSLNWTVRSRAIQGWQWCSSPPEGGQAEVMGPPASSLHLLDSADSKLMPPGIPWLLKNLSIHRAKVITHYRAAWVESSSIQNISGNEILHYPGLGFWRLSTLFW